MDKEKGKKQTERALWNDRPASTALAVLSKYKHTGNREDIGFIIVCLQKEQLLNNDEE